MREIKFRCWDKMNKRMLAPAMPTLGGGITWGNASYDSSSAEYELMQFTGLKDKNGKEVFEGDIVAYMMAGGIDGESACIVSWDETIPGWTAERNRDGKIECLGPAQDWYLHEVIGNIYEHSHLLEATIGGHKMSDNSGPALKDCSMHFPLKKCGCKEGIQLRDWMAGQALLGFAMRYRIKYGHYSDMANHAYRMADAMIAEREGRK